MIDALSWLAVALVAAACTAAMAAPWSARGGSLVATLLLVVPSVILTTAADGVRIALRGRRAPPGWLPALALGSQVAIGGVYLVSYGVVDSPGGRYAIAGYLAYGLAAILIALSTVRYFSGLPRVAALPVSWFLVGLGVELGAIDGSALQHECSGFHNLLLLATLTCFAVGFASLASRALKYFRIPSLVVMLIFIASATPEPWTAIMATYTSHTRIIAAARRLFDRDGDGFSPFFGGGDCDDDDPTAYPLSTVGRDCLGWMSGAAPSPAAAVRPAAPFAPIAAATAPTTVVLVTIDAFRCPPGVCPNLERLAAEGRGRFDAHASFPLTARSITALHTGDLFSNPVRPVSHPFRLASFFAARGFRTAAVVTHPYVLADAGVRASFDTVDERLIPLATAPAGATAELVTDHALAALAEGSGPAFVWAHYLDPHAPYVREAGDVLAGAPEESYAAELRRTDAAIARLAAALARRADAARTLLFVTADHGEGFGEHGARGHGRDLHEEVLRVPMIAWTAGADHRALAPAPLPATTVEIAAYLVDAVTGAPFANGDIVFARIHTDDDTQLAVIDRRGWKLIYHRALNFVELYDLARDPDERRDLAAAAPARVAELGHTLAAYYRALNDRKARDLDELHLLAAGP